jgi:hypothetical protein
MKTFKSRLQLASVIVGLLSIAAIPAQADNCRAVYVEKKACKEPHIAVEIVKEPKCTKEGEECKLYKTKNNVEEDAQSGECREAGYSYKARCEK